ncbi:RNase H domain-containing protein [Trichonephila clavipes]|nr:RNase H domain-containing protein [Trichonephila clavipes]
MQLSGKMRETMNLIPTSFLQCRSADLTLSNVTKNRVLKKGHPQGDGSKLNGRVGLACVIYEEGVENVTFQHRLRDECSVFQVKLLCINLVVKLIQDSFRQDETLNFLICTVSLYSLHCFLSVNSTEKLVVEVQSILYYLDCDIHFSYVRCHSGNLGNDRADQSAKE